MEGHTKRPVREMGGQKGLKRKKRFTDGWLLPLRTIHRILAAITDNKLLTPFINTKGNGQKNQREKKSSLNRCDQYHVQG